jgi:ubiquinone/menaquinone biosynthesis C-methylase UbiE
VCTDKIYQSIVDNIKILYPSGTNISYLDIGAGEGDLIDRVIQAIPVKAEACDLHIDRFKLADVPIKEINLNAEPLPYPPSSFDLVTSTEVIEHLENPRGFFRDVARILKPGGHVLITTPNVLNLKSRLRYLISGFFSLFEPLPINPKEFFSIDSHITPISSFYIAHGLESANLKFVNLVTDKYQRTSVLLLCLLWPILLIAWPFFYLRQAKKNYLKDCQLFVKLNLSLRVLLGRTVIFIARKTK